MIHRDLHEFIATLERLEELHRVTAAVDPILEIAAITDRVSKLPGGGKALLFERPKGTSIPVATNLFGSSRRMAAALGVASLNDLTGMMAELLVSTPTGSAGDALASLSAHETFRRYAPEEVAKGRCQEMTEPPDLTRYPILQSWPGDGAPHSTGRFMTLPLVFTHDPESGSTNCGIYRIQVLGADRAAIHWYPGRGGERHYRKAVKRGERLPVAVALGGPPVLPLAALFPLPDGVDEVAFAGVLAREALPMVRCRTSDLMVPAGAEIVIEGHLEPGETVRDGAFGNHTGFYIPGAKVPLLRVSHISRRADCLYPATVVGRPPMEDCHLAAAAGRLMLPLLRRTVPELVDIAFPLEWIFHGGAIVSVTDAAAGRGEEVIRALWATPFMAAARVIVVVDGDTDVRDASRVAWRAMNTADWRRDLIVSERSGAVPFPWFGSRFGIDATRKAGRKGWPRELVPDDATRHLVDLRWEEYGF